MPNQRKSQPDNSPEEEDVGDKLRKGVGNYAKYSGMAIQMGLIITAGVFGGRYLDDTLGTAPYLTVLLALVAIFLALYVSLKDFLTGPKK